MGHEWIGVAGALGGVLVGAFAEAFRARSSFKRDNSWHLFRDEQRILEELYVALEQVRESYGQSVGPTMIDLTTGHRLEPNGVVLPVPWARLRMLVHMYAPSLKGRLAEVEQAGPRLGEKIAEAVVNKSTDRAKNIRLGELVMAANQALQVALESMREELIVLGRELAEGAKAQTDYTRTIGKSSRTAP